MRFKRIAGLMLVFCVVFSGINLVYAQDSEDTFIFRSGHVPEDMSAGNIVEYPAEGGSIYFDTSTGTVIGADCDEDKPGRNITAVNIPETINGVPVKKIGEDAFSLCVGLKSVTLPEGITEIGNEAFSPCRKLEHLNLPESLTSVGDMAFCNSDKIKTFHIPKNLSHAGVEAFTFMNGLESITADPENPIFVSKDGVLYSKDMKTLEVYPMKHPGTTFNIPDSVTKINSSSCAGTVKLKEITIPDSVESIGSRAFEDSFGILSVTIPGSVKTIGDAAFRSCDELRYIEVQEGVTSASDTAFDGNEKLEEIALPQSLNAFESEYPFAGCFSLKKVHCVKGSNVDNPAIYNDLEDGTPLPTITYDYDSFDAKALGDALYKKLSDINSNIKVIINDEPILFEQSPVIENGTTLVPMRTIFSKLGAYLEWHEDTQTVETMDMGNTITIKINSDTATIGDKTVKLSAPARLINGTTMVPLRFIGESLGAEVSWDEATRTVNIVKEYEN